MEGVQYLRNWSRSSCFHNLACMILPEQRMNLTYRENYMPKHDSNSDHIKAHLLPPVGWDGF